MDDEEGIVSTDVPTFKRLDQMKTDRSLKCQIRYHCLKQHNHLGLEETKLFIKNNLKARDFRQLKNITITIS